MDQSNIIIELKQRIEMLRQELLITQLSIIKAVIENEEDN